MAMLAWRPSLPGQPPQCLRLPAVGSERGLLSKGALATVRLSGRLTASLRGGMVIRCPLGTLLHSSHHKWCRAPSTLAARVGGGICLPAKTCPPPPRSRGTSNEGNFLP